METGSGKVLNLDSNKRKQSSSTSTFMVLMKMCQVKLLTLEANNWFSGDFDSESLLPSELGQEVILFFPLKTEALKNHAR